MTDNTAVAKARKVAEALVGLHAVEECECGGAWYIPRDGSPQVGVHAKGCPRAGDPR